MAALELLAFQWLQVFYADRPGNLKANPCHPGKTQVLSGTHYARKTPSWAPDNFSRNFRGDTLGPDHGAVQCKMP